MKSKCRLLVAGSCTQKEKAVEGSWWWWMKAAVTVVVVVEKVVVAGAVMMKEYRMDCHRLNTLCIQFDTSIPPMK